jgi:hypothetical protein
MTPDEYREVAGLFERLREPPESERAAVLDKACTDRLELREQVHHLLEADREAAGESFLDRRAIEDAARGSRWLTDFHEGLAAPRFTH